MIGDSPFAVEPWAVREPSVDLDRLGVSESVFTLSNGHIGLRGNLDEGEPHGLPGTYLNSFCELRPLPYAEGGYGYPESGQAIVNVTNGKLIRLLVDDEPLDVRYGQVVEHERVLDFRTGLLTRDLHWVSPAGKAVRLRSERLVSLVQRSIAAISYTVTAGDEPVQLVLQSELFANEDLPAAEDDPRIEAALARPLVPEVHTDNTTGATLLHSLRGTGLRMAAATDHDVHGPAGTETHSSSSENIGRTTVICRLAPGRSLRIVKYLAYGWSSRRSMPALNDQVRAALTAARYTGWDGLLDEQRAYLDEFWAGADVEVEGDPQLQQAVRFGLFHVLQAGARAEGRAIPAKGLTGPGYDGHTFWDTETFVLPMLSHTVPDAAAHALRWRRETLPLALERAQQLGFEGAAFPWRTIRGQECSGYWPAGTAALHVNADIADAVLRHVGATGDDEFERTVGLELLTATARLWRSVGHHDGDGGFRIDGVTGPDEYSAIADNNLFTNLMAQRNLRGAADVCRRHPDEAAELGVGHEEIASWQDAADAMVLPFDAKRGVHAQSENFTEHALWDFGGTPPEKYPLLLHFPYLDLYRKQVVKQADLVLAMQLCPEAFSPEQKQRNFAYYEQITVRDSSLSAATQGVLAAETGHLGLAYEYLCETGMLDLHDLAGNTEHGLHLAALSGVWSGVVAGFGGLRHLAAGLSFAPRLPEELSRIAFMIRWRGRRLRVEVHPGEARYRLIDGADLELLHHGERLTVGKAEVTAGIPAFGPVEPVRQPVGREPLVRRLRAGGSS
ncbi:glycoside hydrolase family 65 protein [Cryptosporangium arvum]|uniref:Trehalose/maltose hydrolase or phosphorylase n=1 Tax=Cryptosporangium arvum DSM 44712 TaxID=927661 RepID=A0A010Z267_9ACTN|nr:glycosyl hydrolase family 65 protein [Cryptosporangium arvum]EXG81518.1 trehalose/maltose hydrolase or phosphorylase [Cryptosporangium arvum DSM 44712]